MENRPPRNSGGFSARDAISMADSRIWAGKGRTISDKEFEVIEATARRRHVQAMNAVNDPKAVPTIRRDLIAYLNTNAVPVWARIIERNPTSFPTLKPLLSTPLEHAAMLAKRERDRLESGQQFWISPEVVRDAEYASPKIPRYQLQESDLPSKSGIMILGDALRIRCDHFDKPRVGVRTKAAPVLSVGAISWGPHSWLQMSDQSQWEADENGEVKGIWVSIWTIPEDPDEYCETLEFSTENDRRLAVEGLTYGGIMSLLGYEREQLLPFPKGNGQLEWTYRNFRNKDVAPVVKAVLTIWNFMRDRDLTSQRDDRPDPKSRAARKAAKAGRELPSVRVITYKPQTPSEGDSRPTGGKGGKLTKRIVVRGHWRNQWYPSRGEHDQRWVRKHHRGPEWAPGTEKRETVYKVDRPKGQSGK